MITVARMPRGLALAAAFAVSAVSASAQTWTAALNGLAESPPNASPGIGSAIFTLTGNSLRMQITFSGLIGTTTASHIHCCTAAAGTGTAGVATTLPTFASFPLGVTSGSYDNTINLLDATSWNPAFVTSSGGTTAAAMQRLIANFNSGTTYLNVHSTFAPGGEIRGFVLSTVPEPSSVLLMGTGLLGLVVVTVRRKDGAR